MNFGFFGNLEVISHKAVQTYIANIDDCMSSLNYMGHEKLTGSEPWGEDLFAQRCMDLHGVDKVSDFTLTTDAACEAFRPEGEKKNKKWKTKKPCHEARILHSLKSFQHRRSLSRTVQSALSRSFVRAQIFHF